MHLIHTLFFFFFIIAAFFPPHHLVLYNPQKDINASYDVMISYQLGWFRKLFDPVFSTKRNRWLTGQKEKRNTIVAYILFFCAI